MRDSAHVNLQYVRKIKMSEIRPLRDDGMVTRDFIFEGEDGSEFVVTAFCNEFVRAIVDFKEKE